MVSRNCWTRLFTNYCSYLFFDFWYSQVNKSWFICYCERHHSILFLPIWSDLPGRHKKYTLLTTAQTASSAPDKHCKAYKSLLNVSYHIQKHHTDTSVFSLENILTSRSKVTLKWNWARKLWKTLQEVQGTRTFITQYGLANTSDTNGNWKHAQTQPRKISSSLKNQWVETTIKEIITAFFQSAPSALPCLTTITWWVYVQNWSQSQIMKSLHTTHSIIGRV